MTRVDRIANVMPVNRYFLLRTNLHINAAREPDAGNTNKFWKVKPVLDAVRNCCVELPREEYCAVDEQMIPFTGRVPAKQVIKSKPNPVGIKNFVLCGKSGRALDFEFYQGKGTGIPQETKHLGLSASVVILLTNTIPRQMKYKICFDNYFTGIPLIRELKSKGILSVGTARGNRLMGCPLKAPNKFKKEKRGSMEMKVSGEGDICVVRWMDNGPVTLVSNFVGIESKDQVRRWSAAAKEHIMVDRPKCVQVYNDNMGGVDKVGFSYCPL
ncbi:piggyBac transposable element-derived protein 3-like [Anneissia japonica]|uniref:piggyBac transposable element-derived protein 3-like n=1 Tax=Anneissia japonica TaxID=1529436 RepID=UPI00142563FD|nr:piggyBac transposable element-derived protein 3-like [Anneissia japonica]